MKSKESLQGQLHEMSVRATSRAARAFIALRDEKRNEPGWTEDGFDPQVVLVLVVSQNGTLLSSVGGDPSVAHHETALRMLVGALTQATTNGLQFVAERSKSGVISVWRALELVRGHAVDCDLCVDHFTKAVGGLLAAVSEPGIQSGDLLALFAQGLCATGQKLLRNGELQ